MKEKIHKWLYDIKLAIDEIESFFIDRPMSFEEYKDNPLLKRAIERNLEIIGEAINRILKEQPLILMKKALCLTSGMFNYLTPAGFDELRTATLRHCSGQVRFSGWLNLRPECSGLRLTGQKARHPEYSPRCRGRRERLLNHCSLRSRARPEVSGLGSADRYGQILKRNNMRNLLLSLIAFSLLLNNGCKNLTNNREATVIQSEEQYFDLGGVQQYIEILKSSDNNPVLLFIHGGPAWPQTPQFRYFNKEIANKYTVVIWEQRGAGKSYLKNKTPGNISLNQIIDDGQELVEIIKDKFKVEKIYLAGYSWGSIVGLKMVEENPADFFAYIGIAQVINLKQGMEISRAWLRENDTINQDLEAMAVLDSLDKNLIIDDQEAFMKQYQLVYKYGGAVYNQEAGKEVEKAQDFYEDYKDYNWYEAYNYSAQFLVDDLFSTDFLYLKKLSVPVYLILGRHDWNVPSVLALEWYENLDAPKKEVFWMENAAHGTLEEDPDHFNRIMSEMILTKR